MMEAVLRLARWVVLGRVVVVRALVMGGGAARASQALQRRVRDAPLQLIGFSRCRAAVTEGEVWATVCNGKDRRRSRDRIELAHRASRWQSGTPVGRDRGAAGSTRSHDCCAFRGN